MKFNYCGKRNKNRKTYENNDGKNPRLCLPRSQPKENTPMLKLEGLNAFVDNKIDNEFMNRGTFVLYPDCFFASLCSSKIGKSTIMDTLTFWKDAVTTERTVTKITTNSPRKATLFNLLITHTIGIDNTNTNRNSTDNHFCFVDSHCLF